MKRKKDEEEEKEEREEEEREVEEEESSTSSLGQRTKVHSKDKDAVCVRFFASTTNRDKNKREERRPDRD